MYQLKIGALNDSENRDKHNEAAYAEYLESIYSKVPYVLFGCYGYSGHKRE